jgi:hypothetical protein
MKRRKNTVVRTAYVYQYSLLDVLAASPTEPVSTAHRLHQLTIMHQGLLSIETAPEPTVNDWRVCSDAVNIMETLVDMKVVEDSSGLLNDAIRALAEAGRRQKSGKAMRLDALGIQAVRAVLADYGDVLEQVPARTIIQAHRLTEKRIHEILRNPNRSRQVELVDL